MAGKNITIAGATFNGVPSIDVPVSGGGTASFVEISDTTAQASDVAQGKFFYDAQGVKTEGSASGGGGVDVEALSVTQNGTYTAPTGKAYSPVTVNVEGGGSSSYTLIHTEDVTVSTTSTSQSLCVEINGITQAAQANKNVLCTVRDKAGARDGYFFGTDVLVLYNGGTYYKYTRVYRCEGSGVFAYQANAYGVYLYDINSSGRVRIYQRYNSNYSKTIDGTYKINIYLVDWPSGTNPF